LQACSFRLLGYNFRAMNTTLMTIFRPRGLLRWSGLLLGVALLGGCSIKKIAINKLGDALSGSGTAFASDDDPELVKAAVPFSLKLIESLLAESPRHQGLLLAACSGFTQYGYAFVNQDADEMEDSDIAAATKLRTRARKLYLRARAYGLRGLETRHPGFEQTLRKDPKTAVKLAKAGDVPLLFWTAAAWGSAISVSKDDPALVSDQLIVEALIDRALELDEAFDHGAIHGILISYEMARQGLQGDPALRSKEHFDRAMELSGGKLASPLVSYAEAVSVEKQNRAEFQALLEKALAINPDAAPESRLLNLVSQRRARWLLGRVDDLFIGGAKTDEK
jgi:predicted anti-sigma-YlaC factor YlaD